MFGGEWGVPLSVSQVVRWLAFDFSSCRLAWVMSCVGAASGSSAQECWFTSSFWRSLPLCHFLLPSLFSWFPPCARCRAEKLEPEPDPDGSFLSCGRWGKPGGDDTVSPLLIPFLLCLLVRLVYAVEHSFFSDFLPFCIPPCFCLLAFSSHGASAAARSTRGRVLLACSLLESKQKLAWLVSHPTLLFLFFAFLSEGNS